MSIYTLIPVNELKGRVAPTTAAGALLQGDEWYYSNEPCEQAGHIGHRSAKDDSCRECASIAANKKYITEQSKAAKKRRHGMAKVMENRRIAEETKEVWE